LSSLFRLQGQYLQLPFTPLDYRTAVSTATTDCSTSNAKSRVRRKREWRRSDVFNVFSYIFKSPVSHWLKSIPADALYRWARMLYLQFSYQRVHNSVKYGLALHMR